MSNKKRAEMLTQWYHSKNSEDEAAVMIIGYEMYRNLLRGRGKDVNFHLLDIFNRTLQRPGDGMLINRPYPTHDLICMK